jgi:hypothetical protein
MPRFSDVFVYEQSVQEADGGVTFMTCYLLKKVGPHAIQAKFHRIIFDVAGMVLFFVNRHPEDGRDRVEVFGPYPLTTE